MEVITPPQTNEQKKAPVVIHDSLENLAPLPNPGTGLLPGQKGGQPPIPFNTIEALAANAVGPAGRSRELIKRLKTAIDSTDFEVLNGGASLTQAQRNQSNQIRKIAVDIINEGAGVVAYRRGCLTIAIQLEDAKLYQTAPPREIP